MRKLTINASSTIKALQIWNGIFDLTMMELEVLSSLLDTSLDTDTNLCSASNKKRVANLLKVDDYRTLNNYVKRLKDKGAILYENKKYRINSILELKTNKVEINIRRN